MNDFTDILKRISEGSDLNPDQASFALNEIVAGRVNTSQTAAFLFGMSCKGETIEELSSFVQVMRRACVSIEVDTENAVDVCGTGGDKSGTFNISTAAMFVIAGADVPVLKHGNAGVSSRSGSFDVLQSLGARPDLQKDAVETCFRETGIAFMFAPLFHPAMAYVMPARRELKLRTFFNIMGPMLNPAGVKRQVIGAFDEETATKILQILSQVGTEFAYAVHSEDGLDEFSTSAPSHVYLLRKGGIETKKTFRSELFGMEKANPAALKGGSPEDNAEIIRSVLDDKASNAQRDIVLLNAAFGIHASGLFDDLHDAFYAAQESLETGRARQALNHFVTATQDA